jgi:hypothetical protein
MDKKRKKKTKSGNKYSADYFHIVKYTITYGNK